MAHVDEEKGDYLLRSMKVYPLGAFLSVHCNPSLVRRQSDKFYCAGDVQFV